jgi:hypothetical protein
MPAVHSGAPGAARSTRTARASLPGVAEEKDERDLAARQADIAASMDETIERQREVQRRQDELLEQLGRISKALDEKGESPPAGG